MKRFSFVLLGIAMFLGGIAVTQAQAGPPSCYPTCPTEADARLGGIAVSGQVFVGQNVPVRVAGRNIGGTGDVITTDARSFQIPLRAAKRGAKINPQTPTNGPVDPKGKQSMFVRAGQKYNVYFTWTPAVADAHGQTSGIKANTQAKSDANPSNGDGVVYSHVG